MFSMITLIGRRPLWHSLIGLQLTIVRYHPHASGNPDYPSDNCSHHKENLWRMFIPENFYSREFYKIVRESHSLISSQLTSRCMDCATLISVPTTKRIVKHF